MAKVGLDNFQRASYLYQLSWAAMRTRPDRPAASHHYSHMLTEFCQKAVLRMERGLKRTVCAACHVLLVPGTTCSVRTRSRPQRCQVWRCRACGQCRRFPCPRPSDRRQRRKKAQAAAQEAQEAQEAQPATEGTVGGMDQVGVANRAEKTASGSGKAMKGEKKTAHAGTR